MVKALVHKARTGVRRIDAANEGLCFLIGRMFEPLVECRRRTGHCDRRACTKIAALVAFTRRNFAAQEELMRAISFPHADEHARDHQRLLDDLEILYRSNVCADIERARVREVLLRWIAAHVTAEDSTLGDWARTRRELVALVHEVEGRAVGGDWAEVAVDEGHMVGMVAE